LGALPGRSGAKEDRVNPQGSNPGVRALWASLALVACAVPSFAWGPVVHHGVTEKAIDTLPKGLQPFYKAHKLEIPSLGPDAPPSDEGPDRRFPADAFAPFPFKDLPISEAEAKEHFKDNPALQGRLPWLIMESYGRLVEAFKKGDKDPILRESDVLSGYVTDLHNPLALTENYDGQKTDQHGLWVRFSVKFPEIVEKKARPDPDAARFLDDPKRFITDIVRANYIWIDNLLYADDLAHRGKSGYGDLYYESLDIRATPLLKGCMSRAAEDVGSYWYTAWTAAGRPILK
jgi:hypothetical protein